MQLPPTHDWIPPGPKTNASCLLIAAKHDERNDPAARIRIAASVTASTASPAENISTLPTKWPSNVSDTTTASSGATTLRRLRSSTSEFSFHIGSTSRLQPYGIGPNELRPLAESRSRRHSPDRNSTNSTISPDTNTSESSTATAATPPAPASLDESRGTTAGAGIIAQRPTNPVAAAISLNATKSACCFGDAPLVECESAPVDHGRPADESGQSSAHTSTQSRSDAPSNGSWHAAELRKSNGGGTSSGSTTSSNILTEFETSTCHTATRKQSPVSGSLSPTLTANESEAANVTAPSNEPPAGDVARQTANTNPERSTSIEQHFITTSTHARDFEPQRPLPTLPTASSNECKEFDFDVEYRRRVDSGRPRADGHAGLEFGGRHGLQSGGLSSTNASIDAKQSTFAAWFACHHVTTASTAPTMAYTPIADEWKSSWNDAASSNADANATEPDGWTDDESAAGSDVGIAAHAGDSAVEPASVVVQQL